MKVLTHEEWMKNPTPRMMLVWDDDYDSIGKMKVVYVSKQDIRYPVITLADNDLDICKYKHCAEIEKPKTRRMTNKELSRWLRENPTREYKYCSVDDSNNSFVYHSYSYIENCADKEISDRILIRDNEISERILIRENDGEWREPLVEEE